MATILTPECELPTLDKLLARYTRPRRRQRMEPLYQEMLAEAAELIAPKAIHQAFSLDETEALNDGFRPETVAAVLAICTLGSAIDQRVERLNQSNMALAVILEEIALATVVNLTQALHGTIRGEYQSQGLKAGPAYRPGIGRWPMSAQRTLFALLPAAHIEVELTEDLYMLPVQSTSLIIPIMDRRNGQ